MTLEQVIRYAITGILLQGGMTEDMNDSIQELVSILIDFPDDTDKDIVSILSGKWRGDTK